MLKISHSNSMDRKRAINIPASILALCLTFCLWHGGCSEEETAQQFGEPSTAVVSINKDARGKTEFGSPPGQEKPEDAGEASEEHYSDVREIKRERPDIKTGEKQAEPEEEITGYYTIKPGEGLSEIAARDEVYGDPLKWPILYSYNKDKIGELQLVEGFLDRGLPEGERLKIITPGKARENLQQRAECNYAVNVLSARSQRGLISSAIRLMREGYPVYITSATVEGMKWMRLRVGFFKSMIEASLERTKINDLLRIHDSWITEVGQEELEEFGGLIPSLRKVE
jgi:hypothetical protein